VASDWLPVWPMRKNTESVGFSFAHTKEMWFLIGYLLTNEKEVLSSSESIGFFCQYQSNVVSDWMPVDQ
jgi:hypothetical protein